MAKAKAELRRPSRARDPLAKFESDVTARVVDLRIDVKRKKTGETLLTVGGRWDRVEQRYLDETSERGKVLYLNESQLEAFDGIRQWIEARRSGSPRVVEIVLDGARGSGKTHLAALAVFVIAMEFPDARCWLVNPANTRRSEVDRIVRDHIPRQWRAWSERDLTYTLPNGSTVSYLGAEDENALKQGGYEVALLNEAQLIASTAYANVAAGVRNVSGRPKGLLLVAHNYASKERGEWTNDHLDKIEAKLINAIRFKMDARLNSSIDSDVVDDIDGLIRSVRPDLADIDALGIRKRLGEYAARAFKPFAVVDGGHVGLPPSVVRGIDGSIVSGWPDITRELTADKTNTRNGYPVVFGADFQRRPGCVAVAFRLFRREDRKTVFFAEKCIIAGDNEDDLARKMEEWLDLSGLTARDALVVADSTGRHQNAYHDKRTKPSHDILREWDFTVVAPRKVKKNGALGNANPDVEDSLAQFYDVCNANRFLVHPDEQWKIDCLRKCKLKKRGGTIRLDDSYPGYSHSVDCDRYVTWYFEPRRGPAVRTGIDPKIHDALSGISLFSSR